jgi:hypothetical protein
MIDGTPFHAGQIARAKLDVVIQQQNIRRWRITPQGVPYPQVRRTAPP